MSQTNNLSKNLSLVVWNVRSIRARLLDIFGFVNEFNPAIMCLSEVMLSTGDNLRFPNYSMHSKPRNNHGGGVAILVRKDISFNIPSYNDFRTFCDNHGVDIAIVQLNVLNRPNLFVVVIYNPPSSSLNRSDPGFWDGFFSFCVNLGDVIITGDFNGHAELWSLPGSRFNHEGREIEKAILNHDLICLNDDSYTWCSSDTSSRSILDLVFTKQNLALNFGFEVLHHSYGSDHFPILLSFNDITSTSLPCRPSFSTSKVDWEKFKSLLDASIKSLLRVSYDSFLQSIIDALINSGGSIKHALKASPNKHSSIWWNQRCSELRDQKKNLFSNLTANPSIANLNAYNSFCIDFKKEINNIRKVSFNNFCESLDVFSDPKKVWSTLKSFKNHRSAPIKPPSEEGKLKALSTFKKLIPSHAADDPILMLHPGYADPVLLRRSAYHMRTSHHKSGAAVTSSYTLFYNKRNQLNHDIIKPIQLGEIKSALHAVKSKSAHGPDCVPNSAIKNLSESSIKSLFNIYNLIFNKGSFPLSWKDYFMIFLPKANSNDLRPISLSNSLLKIFEKIICARLEYWCENLYILPEFQFGFRRGRSTSDSLTILSTEIRLAFAKKSKLGALFLDIKGAFDNVSPEILKQILLQLGLPNKIVRFIYFVVSERFIHGYYNGLFLGKRTARRGVPQGSVLSPILYCLYTAFLSRDITEDISVLAYADDIAVYTRSDDLRTIFNRLNAALAHFHCVLAELGLELSCSKSKACIFSDGGQIRDNNAIRRLSLSISFLDKVVPVVDSVRFLGVEFDRKLSWIPHAINIRANCNKRINVLKAIAGIKWGAHPSTMIRVYQGWIRSLLDYGCTAFLDIRDNAAAILDRVQFSALRIALSLMRTTPTNVILHLAGEMPLEDRRSMLAKRYGCKILSYNHHPIHNIFDEYINLIKHRHISVGSKFLETLILLNQKYRHLFVKSSLPGPLEFSFFSRFIPISVETQIGSKLRTLSNHSSRNGRSLLAERVTSPQLSVDDTFRALLREKGLKDTYLFYTDGSRIPEVGTGCAIHNRELNLDLRYNLCNILSIFEAEAIAILHALRIIFDKSIQKAAVISDSLSVLSGLASPDPGGRAHHLIHCIKDLLFLLYENKCQITFIWIPGHSGLMGNERADLLAKDGANNINLAGPHQEFCFAQNLFTTVRNESINSSMLRLLSDTAFRGFRYFNKVKEKNLSPWFCSSAKLPRSVITLISRLRSQHVCLAAHLNDKNIVEDPRCECGFPAETIQHAFECPLRGNESLLLPSRLIRAGAAPGQSVLDIAFDNNRDAWLILEQFVRNTNLQI